MKFGYRIVSGIIAGVLLFSGMVSAVGSTTTDSLPKDPEWKIALKKLDGFTEAPYHVPNSNTVYLQSYTLVNSATKVWDVGVVTAADKTTGKEKWSYQFYKKGTPFPMNTSKFAYSKGGSVYALVSDALGTKLHSVNSSGKSNWTIAVPEVQDVYAMNDGTLLLVNRFTRDSSGKFKVYAFNANGKKISEQSVSDMYAVVGGQYLISQIAKQGSAKLEVFGPKLNRLFTYPLPDGAVTSIDEGSWVINNGDILIRMNIPKSGNRLISLNSQGKTLWGRTIAGNASVQSIGDSYVVYENGEMSLFNSKGLIKKKNIKLDDPMHEILNTPDNKILVYSENGRSIIDPSTLELIYNYPFDQKLLNYYYAGDGYLYAISDEYQLLQYKLSKS
ncbi:PQQ-binding-like beta-propeller repeat protein [Paenibacillus terrigena]|uniref:outer membrane protein assembly factor BamB family protein n=1 Tax=Paenibacillus terrigena TaxID=369333 RepID=UPI00037782FE|nr:PQQ-binding-like beta-propeller repeat protein [Paenibacillus terrigena]